MASAKTKPGTQKLSEAARKVVVPKGVTSTGWPAVRDKCADLGIAFRPWQDGAGRLILAKRADGKYAATVGGTGMSIPRQVGKTFLVGAIVFALCLLRPGLTVIWTAHRLRTAEETFGKMQAFAKRHKIKPHIEKITLGSGEEAIQFRNGSRILFGARESGFGLGFDEVDVLIFDEAQRLRDLTLDDMVPATNQSRQDTGALLLFMGTPPRPTDSGEVFTRMRTEATTGEDEDTAWIEMGADPDFIPTPKPAPLKPADWAQVEKANPSFPDDTPREAILRMRKQLTDASYIREGLGIWDEERTGGAIEGGKWKALKDSIDQPDDIPAIGLGGSPDGMFGAIGAASVLDDGRVMVAPVGKGRQRGQRWLVDEAARIQKERGCAVVVASRGPLKYLIPDLVEAGVDVTQRDASEWVDACEVFWQAVDGGTLVHPGDKGLSDSALSAAWKKTGDRRSFARDSMSPLIEATALAARHVLNSPRSAYEDHDFMAV